MKQITILIAITISLCAQDLNEIRLALADDDPDIREKAVKDLVALAKKNIKEIEQAYSDETNDQVRGMIAQALSESHSFAINADEKEAGSYAFSGDEIVLEGAFVVCQSCGFATSVVVSPTSNYRQTARLRDNDPVHTILTRDSRFRIYVYENIKHNCAEDCKFAVVMSGLCPETHHPVQAKSGANKLDKILIKVLGRKG